MTDSPEKTVILCPGQGAQHVGMGTAWIAANAKAADTFARADDALGFSLTKLCADGPAEELNRTDNAQVALYVTGVACYRALEDRGEISEKNTVAAAGLSLGEFTALHLAGAISFEDGLKLVRLRGQAMQDAAEQNPSTMVAITGDVSEEKINDLCKQALAADGVSPDSVLVPANFNSAMQIVVSGSFDACEKAVNIAGDMGLKPTPLTVAGAFHSPLMRPAADRLAAALDAVTWSAPRIPVMSNVTAAPHPSPTHTDTTAATDATATTAAVINTIKQNLTDQLTHPVRWAQDMQYLITNFPAPIRYIELAPNKTLGGLMRRIDKSVRVQNKAEPA